MTNSQTRHAQHTVSKKAIYPHTSGNCYLGIDAGSTTTKVALVGEDGSLLYSLLQQQQRKPVSNRHPRHPGDLRTSCRKPRSIAYSCSTGYGEALLKSALMLDEGEVETISHYYAAAFFDPDVDCILDIGGQDMKCIKHQGSHRGQRTAQRGLFLRLRFLHRDLRKLLKLQRPGFREGRALCQESHRPGYPLYRIHELQRKTGPERGCNRRRYLRWPCLLRHQERFV